MYYVLQDDFPLLQSCGYVWRTNYDVIKNVINDLKSYYWVTNNPIIKHFFVKINNFFFRHYVLHAMHYVT